METAQRNLRMEVLDGLPVYIIDDCIDPAEAASYHDKACKLTYSRGEKDFDGDEYPVFSCDFDPISFADKFSVGRIANELLRELLPDSECTLFRSYINMIHYGDVEYPHRDCEIGKGNITILFYLNKTWDYTWGGETKFYEDGEPRILVLPKPGRCTIFYGEVEHMAGIPSRTCSSSRFTLALKYVVEKKKDAFLVF